MSNRQLGAKTLSRFFACPVARGIVRSTAFNLNWERQMDFKRVTRRSKAISEELELRAFLAAVSPVWESATGGTTVEDGPRYTLGGTDTVAKERLQVTPELLANEPVTIGAVGGTASFQKLFVGTVFELASESNRDAWGSSVIQKGSERDSAVVELLLRDRNNMNAVLQLLSDAGLKGVNSAPDVGWNVVAELAMDELKAISTKLDVFVRSARFLIAPISRAATTEAYDSIKHRVNDQFAKFGFQGTGVKIGIISNSFNRLSGYATDRVNGEFSASGAVGGVQTLLEGPLGSDD
jgi:hypothetical protein